jgi:hypothetical protein
LFFEIGSHENESTQGRVRKGKTPKKLASICCLQRRETKADTLKATEVNRRRGPGTREKVR